MRKTIYILTIFTLLLIGLPLIGVFMSGRSALDFVSFPPLTKPEGHAPFSWPVFVVYLLLAIGVLLIIGAAACKTGTESGPHRRSDTRSFPWWGWCALVGVLLSWFLAWTRLPWMEAFQRNTFIPLWFFYVLLANALCYRQSQECPLVDRPGFFLGLFPLSAAFWWYFEYLNQFVHNWYYTGVDYGPVAYSIHATISFSTVLPAVYTTRVFLGNAKWLRSRFCSLPSLPKPGSTGVYTLLVLAGAGLIGLGLRPDYLFSMLWIAPLVLLSALQALAGQTTIFSAMADGDWRPAISAALAALICGFFWEMWNYYSLAKWMYSISYVYRFKVFEMPILGYMGYLPFGLECVAIAELFGGSSSHGKRYSDHT